MNKRKIQGLINRIEDNIVKYKKEMQLIDNTKDDYKDTYQEIHDSQNEIYFQGRIDEARNIKSRLVMLKESIND